MKNNLIFAIDFDGTCVGDSFPEIGKDIGSVKVLKKLVDKGHKIILTTVRCNHEIMPNSSTPGIYNIKGNFLDDAVNWFKENDIPLYGIQKHPDQENWTSSPKCYFDYVIDDRCFGIPLYEDESISDKPFVNWFEVERLLKQKNII